MFDEDDDLDEEEFEDEDEDFEDEDPDDEDDWLEDDEDIRPRRRSVCLLRSPSLPRRRTDRRRREIGSRPSNPEIYRRV